MPIKYLKSAGLKNKTVLLRVDFNEPIDPKTGQLADDFRLRAILPTIQFLREQGNKIIICGHLGRPLGEWNKKLSLKPIAERLANLLDCKFIETDRPLPDYPLKHLIFYTGNLLDGKAKHILDKALPRDIVLLENLRFYKGEEANDPVFAKKLADLAEVYVNDAFAVDHHPAASLCGVEKYLPSFGGLLLEKEIKSLSVVLERAEQPFVVMMGGIKLSDKVQTLEHLGQKAEKILIGGGLSSLFFLAKGLEVGLSKVEEAGVKIAWQLEKNYKEKLVLPVDVVVANADMDKRSIRVTAPHEIGKKEMILDLGPKTILQFAQILKTAKTIVWNGPLGHFEVKPFDTATLALARIVGAVSSRKAYGVIGGGETIEAVRQAGQLEHIDHVSTGGGAMLEFLAGKKLPGIEALK